MSLVRTLTIAGLDVTGGAGLAADLKTFEEYGTFGTVALTTIVSMDPDNNWNHRVTVMDRKLIEEQLQTIFSSDIPISAAKTGMLGTVEMVDVVYETFKNKNFKNLVIDPVLVCKGTDEVLNPEVAEAIREKLLPLSRIITPNLFEAGALAGMPTPKNLEEMKSVASKLFELGANAIVIKGGKAISNEKAIDLFYDGKNYEILIGDKLSTNTNHGAGCTFAAAITAGLANGLELIDAVKLAKNFTKEAISSGFEYNKFIGPVFHGAYRIHQLGEIK